MNMIKIAFVVCCAAFATAEAEADAGLLYGGYGGGYAGLGYGAGLGYAGLGYGYGLAAPIATGYGVSNVANTVGIAGVAPAALPALAGGYAGAGRYVANSAGVVHVAKREAEPEAEAGLLYRGYGYGGLGYAGLGYAGLGYARRGYAGLGYGYAAPATYGYYGKRSAEAEPEADAGLYYGGYGHGAGLGYAGYGGYGYGHGAGLGYAGYGLRY